MAAQRQRFGSVADGSLDFRIVRPGRESIAFMLLDGFNHVAILTSDSGRFIEFYRDVFGVTVAGEQRMGDEGMLTLLEIGGRREINLFEVRGNSESQRQTPMFGRGRLDHLGLQAASLEAFEEIRARLMARGAADHFVTDFGPVLSVFFRDPDGLEGEVCVANPDAVPGLFNAPGTPAARFTSGGT